MKSGGKRSRVYRFDPDRKKKLKSVDYVSPEKKQLLRDRKQAGKDRRNFFIGAGLFLLVVLALAFYRLRV
ncbi:MAG: hypothetical protein K6T66_03155 [Peptococcaceae bacterium]|nr:hypothetical protein [Peptococcaceae bacterium]